MERPWLILRRVIDVHPPGDLHVGVEDVEDLEAEEAAMAAQEQLEESVVIVNTNVVISEIEHTLEMGAGGPDFSPDITVTVAAPPRISALFADQDATAHPDPQRPDMYPYIIATGRFCLLVHFSIAPSFGTNFRQQPSRSHLVVVRHFLRDDDGAQIAARAEHMPDRPYDFPALSNIQSVGLVCNQATGDIQIAELIVPTGDLEEASVVCIRTTEDTDVWQWRREYFTNPCLDENSSRDWVPHGTVTVNGTLLWFDLSWGMISCDFADPHLFEHELHYHRLPPGRVLRAGAGNLPDLHCRRCIAVSENLVRYVEIILEFNQAATTVNMWYRDLEANPWQWKINYSERFQDIWDDESYQQAGLPRYIPFLVGVSPVNSSVVYFSLDQRLFGVNVPEHRVVDCEQYEPLNMPGPPDEPVTSRYLITWNLDADQAIPNVGHRPDEPSDHEDSCPRGPMDEGDVDYQAPSEDDMQRVLTSKSQLTEEEANGGHEIW